MLNDYLKEKGLRENIEIVYSYPKVAQAVTDGLFLQGPTSEVLPTSYNFV